MFVFIVKYNTDKIEENHRTCLCTFLFIAILFLIINDKEYIWLINTRSIKWLLIVSIFYINIIFFVCKS